MSLVPQKVNANGVHFRYVNQVKIRLWPGAAKRDATNPIYQSTLNQTETRDSNSLSAAHWYRTLCDNNIGWHRS